MIMEKRSFILAFLLATAVTTTTAFAPMARPPATRQMRFALRESSSTDSLPEISEMKLKDIRQELESYGISTKSFLEKPEYIAALEKARKEGKKPKKDASRSGGGRSGSSSSSTKEESGVNGQSGKPREERLREEMEKAKSMSVSDLRKELTSRGIKSNAFFEKSDFVKAYAEAIVDGVKAKSSSSASGGNRRSQEEEYDPSYRDVQCRKLDPSSRRMLGSVIDIRK